jgi:hypothetical protein
MKEEEKSFNALIIFIVFIFIKKIYDFIISVIYPEQEIYLNKDLDKIQLRKIAIRFRTLFSLISLFWVLYLATFYKYNTTIYLLLFFVFISSIFYLLFEKRVIYYLIDKEKLDSKIIDNLDKEGGIVINIIYLLIFSYIMYKLFARKNK